MHYRKPFMSILTSAIDLEYIRNSIPKIKMIKWMKKYKMNADILSLTNQHITNSPHIFYFDILMKNHSFLRHILKMNDFVFFNGAWSWEAFTKRLKWSSRNNTTFLDSNFIVTNVRAFRFEIKKHKGCAHSPPRHAYWGPEWSFRKRRRRTCWVFLY